MNFCFYCGTGPVERSTVLKAVYWKCSICQGEFSIIIHKESQITLEEAQAAFNKIPLTDKKAVRAAKRRRKE